MISEIIKLRIANGSVFITVPKKIVAQIPPDTTHFLIFLEDDEIILRPLNCEEVCDD